MALEEKFEITLDEEGECKQGADPTQHDADIGCSMHQRAGVQTTHIG